MSIHFEVFSDGGSINNGYKDPNKEQYCSSAAVVTLNEQVISKGGSSKVGDGATNSYGEVYGALSALKLVERKINQIGNIPKPYNVTLYSDSAYVINSASKYISGWRKRDWKNKEGKDVAQKELWQVMDKRFINNPDWNIDFVHVKGHTGNQDFHSRMNDLCDKICGEQLDKYR